MLVRPSKIDSKQGNGFFFDLNMWGENICLEKTREYIMETAEWHDISLHPKLTNEEAITLHAKKYPSSPYAKTSWDLIASFQPYIQTAQKVVTTHAVYSGPH